MWIDSHCHLNYLMKDATDWSGLDAIIAQAVEADVAHMLCVAVCPDEFSQMLAIAQRHPTRVKLTAGVHPNEVCRIVDQPDWSQLLIQAQRPEVIAIGETGLDYYRNNADSYEHQAYCFRQQIALAKQVKKPLVIHTRSAAEDTLRILHEESAGDCGGVVHCFSEDWDVAKKVLDLGLNISFTGIVTFSNANTVREVVQKVPADRFMLETDSPYLAPVPYRGKPNQPAWLVKVAYAVAELRSVAVSQLSEQMWENTLRIFPHII